MNKNRIFNYTAFLCLMGSSYFGYHFVWGVLFLYWTIPNIRTGEVLLITPIFKDEDPVLFWLIQVAWILFGMLLLVSDFFPEWLIYLQ